MKTGNSAVTIRRKSFPEIIFRQSSSSILAIHSTLMKVEVPAICGLPSGKTLKMPANTPTHFDVFAC